MTSEEYEALSEQFAAKNLELNAAIANEASLDTVNGIRSQAAELRRQLDDAWLAVNEIPSTVGSDPLVDPAPTAAQEG